MATTDHYADHHVSHMAGEDELVERDSHPIGTAAPDSGVRYVLVTPDMLERMTQSGNQPNHVISPQAHSPTYNGTEASTAVQSEKPAQDQVEVRPTYEIAEESPYLPNPLARLRFRYREYLGEFLGTMVLILFGNGVDCQTILTNWANGSYLSLNMGWGLGVLFGVHASGGISGGHINPAVTVSLAVFRGFPWRKVPGYIFAQFLGACVAAAIILGNYHNLLDQYEGGYNVRTFGKPTSTATVFFTAPAPFMSNIGAFFDEVLGTAILVGSIFAVTDANNNPAPMGLNGLIIMWLVAGIGMILGVQTGYAINPARDFGPRVACAMFGYGREIWTYRHAYWIWGPIIGPFFGGILGGFVYDLLIYTGKESPLNWPWGKKQKAIAAESNHRQKV